VPTDETADRAARARFGEPGGDGALRLLDAAVEQTPDALTLALTWAAEGSLARDGKLFVHLYADPAAPPVAQIDARLGHGVLPPANWLPGPLDETLTLSLADVPPGTYTLALGVYDPVTGDRYPVLDAPDGAPSDRLVLGEIER
jgi:hypothetical protein